MLELALQAIADDRSILRIPPRRAGHAGAEAGHALNTRVRGCLRREEIPGARTSLTMALATMSACTANSTAWLRVVRLDDVLRNRGRARLGGEVAAAAWRGILPERSTRDFVAGHSHCSGIRRVPNQDCHLRLYCARSSSLLAKAVDKRDGEHLSATSK